MTTYNWPGNVRGLASVIDRAAILGDGERLEVAKSLGLASNASIPNRSAVPAPPNVLQPTPALSSIDDAMKRHIETALTFTRGRIEGPYGAAAVLKINPHTLRGRMRKLGIDWRAFRKRNTQ